MIPDPILASLRSTYDVQTDNFIAVSGGCINKYFKLTYGNKPFFLKWNYADSYPKMFELEQKGLNLLRLNSSFIIPEVFEINSIENYSWILMEHIPNGRINNQYWSQFGYQLAELHQVTNSTYGLEFDNYIGSLIQQNNESNNWNTFFIEQRITPQLKLAINSENLDSSILSKFDNLFKLLSEIFPKEKPALLHGDLWSGNQMPTDYGKPCVFDPAVYFGHREMELSYTKLFGGFDAAFYQAYKEVFPIASKFEQRMPIYNLYPLLVHVNLFGGGYINQVKNIINQF